MPLTFRRQTGHHPVDNIRNNGGGSLSRRREPYSRIPRGELHLAFGTWEQGGTNLVWVSCMIRVLIDTWE